MTGRERDWDTTEELLDARLDPMNDTTGLGRSSDGAESDSNDAEGTSHENASTCTLDTVTAFFNGTFEPNTGSSSDKAGESPMVPRNGGGNKRADRDGGRLAAGGVLPL